MFLQARVAVRCLFQPRRGRQCSSVYARRGISPERLGGLIDRIASIAVGTKEAQRKDILGRVYEYFLGKFAAAEGKLGGEFFTPSSVVRLMVEMIEPYEGRVYDPACGSGGMFVQSERFVEAHGGTKRNLSVFGQESNPTTWRLAHMNLAIRGIEANLGEQPADTFARDLHPDLKADYILANPPFNISDWSGELLRSEPNGDYSRLAVAWGLSYPPRDIGEIKLPSTVDAVPPPPVRSYASMFVSKDQM